MMQTYGLENFYTDQKPHPLHTWSEPGMKPHPPRKLVRPPVEVPREEDDDHNYCTIPPLASKTAGTRTKKSNSTRFLSHPMLLPDFVAQYSKQLPVQIKVTTGYCGPSSRLTISTDDSFNVHLVKRAKVVHVADSQGTVYSVPLNSSIEFGLVYDPVDSDRKGMAASAGFKLRVSDMMGLDMLPKVLCCLKAWKNESLALDDLEQVVVKGVQKSRVKSKRGLKVLSLRTKKEMVLPEDCKALFTTEPGLVKMLLMDMVQYVDNPLPNLAMVVLGGELYTNKATSKKVHEIPDVLVSRVVTLSEVIVETSLISSAVIDTKAPYLEGYSLEELHQMIDIPLEGGLLEVQVAVVEIDETDKLYEDTHSIYEKFSPHRVKRIRDLMCDRAAAAQWLFSTMVLSGWRETHGIELDEPTYKYTSFSLSKGKPSNESVSDSQWSSIGSDRHSLSGSRRSLASIGSVQEVQLASAPQLPPREIPRKGSSPLVREEEKGQRDFTQQEGRGFHTLPHSFRANGSKLQDTANTILHPGRPTPQPAPPTEPRPQPLPPPTEPRPQPALPPVPHSRSGPPTVPRPLPVLSAISRPVPATPTTPSHTSSQQNGSSPLDHASRHNHQGQRSIPRRGRNDDSLLDGSLSSCEDGVFGGPGNSLGGLEGSSGNRETLWEQRLAAMEQALREGSGDKGQEVEWKLKVEKRLTALESQLSDILHHISGKSPSQAMPTRSGGCGYISENNESCLRRLNVQQVQDMLAAMDLPQYMEAFKRERVSGDIMLELGDEVLKDDLGVDCKLHRLRLMKVISCQHSVTDIL